jgi:parallel beta-helix repeat protein
MIKTSYVCIVAVVCLLSAGRTVFATNYYVKPDGNDANSGLSLTLAWKTFAKATQCKPGDIVFFADGQYQSGQVAMSGFNGTENNRLVWKSINKWGARILITSSYPAIHIMNSTGITIDGFYLDGSKADHHGILIQNCNFATVRNCYAYNFGGGGINGNSSDNLLFENNIARSNAKRHPMNASGISTYQPTAKGGGGEYGIIMRANICFENECRLPFTLGGSSVPTDGNGIILDDHRNTQSYVGSPNSPYTRKTLVENNVLYNNGGKGINVFLSDNVIIRNNTMYSNNYVLSQYTTWGLGEICLYRSNGSAIYNNITVKNSTLTNTRSIFTQEVDAAIPIRNNIMVGPSSFTTSAAGNNISSSDYNNFAKFVSPGLTEAANFRLLAGSPAIGTGYSSNYASHDFDGVSRPQSGTIDIGAFEYIGTSLTPTPPTAPGGLVAQAGSSSTVSLNWTDNSNNESGFEIERKSSSQNFTKIGTTGAGQTTFSDNGLAASTPYTYRVRAINSAGASAFSNEIAVTTKAAVPGEVVYAVNCGGDDYTDAAGTLYLADRNFSGGTSHLWNVPIAGTTDDLLYQSERYGSSFEYRIPVANGTYDVVIKLAENFVTAQGARVFKISVEGSLKADAVDIFASAGASNAFDLTYQVTVSDGELHLLFEATTENAKANALVIRRAATVSSFRTTLRKTVWCGNDQHLHRYDLRGKTIQRPTRGNSGITIVKEQLPADRLRLE